MRSSALATVGLSLAVFAPLAHAQPGASGLIVEGQVIAREIRVRIDCGRRVGAVYCDVEQRFELEAEGSVGRFTASGLNGLEVSLDFHELTDVSLPVGRRVAVVVRYNVGGGRGWPILVPPLSLRHPVFDASWRFYPPHGSVAAAMPRGDGLRIEGDVVYSIGGADGLSVRIGTESVVRWPHRSTVWSDVRVDFHHEAESFANAGPVITVGGQVRTDAPGATPLLGVGYEVGLVELLVLSVGFETNLDAIAQALVLELVSPGLFILPSIAAGAGLVVTELGPRGVDAALRLRLTLSTLSVGFVADFDFILRREAGTSVSPDALGSELVAAVSGSVLLPAPRLEVRLVVVLRDHELAEQPARSRIGLKRGSHGAADDVTVVKTSLPVDDQKAGRRPGPSGRSGYGRARCNAWRRCPLPFVRTGRVCLPQRLLRRPLVGPLKEATPSSASCRRRNLAGARFHPRPPTSFGMRN